MTIHGTVHVAVSARDMMWESTISADSQPVAYARRQRSCWRFMNSVNCYVDDAYMSSYLCHVHNALLQNNTASDIKLLSQENAHIR